MIQEKNTIEILHLSKQYSPNAPYSVRDISFSVCEGEIVGILGSNGAGKTTTLKCLAGMIPITEGDVEICGYSMKTNPKKAKQNLDFVTDNHAVFEKMTGMEYINFMADIFRVPGSVRCERLYNLQQTINLGSSIFNEISSYSHGMKQKVSLMGALIHAPKVWVLDEPLTGLDPQTSNELKQLIYAHRNAGNSVLFSSHNLDVVEKLCDKAYIINRGKLIDSIIMDVFRQSHTESLEEYFVELVAKDNAGAASVMVDELESIPAVDAKVKKKFKTKDKKTKKSAENSSQTKSQE